MTNDLKLTIEEFIKPKTKKDWMKGRIQKPLPFKWTVHEGKKIYTYGYCHTKNQAFEIGERELIKIGKRKERNIL